MGTDVSVATMSLCAGKWAKTRCRAGFARVWRGYLNPCAFRCYQRALPPSN